MKLRRGFKKEAEAYAKEFREELGLRPDSPLDPWALADLLCIPAKNLSEHPAIPAEVKQHFRGIGNDEFSATTLADGSFREIIVNDYQHPNRQRSSLTHEIAHVVLGHPPKPPLISESCRSFDAEMEKEANELGFTILVPKIAALNAVENFASLRAASEYYEVSVSLMNFRVKITNANGWAKNRARAFGGR